MRIPPALGVARLPPPPWLGKHDTIGSRASESEPQPNTFPNTPLVVKVEIALQYNLRQPETTWVWADITNYVRHSSAIDITTGRKDEHALVEAGSMSLTLDNRDGRFSRRNPTSPYYPYLSKNTPIRVSVNAGSGFTTRAKMFVNTWPNRPDISRQDVTMPLSCSGILRRLGQGQVKKSPLRRFYNGVTSPAPIGYWPLEEVYTATSAKSGLVGGASLTYVLGLGRVTPGEVAGAPFGALSGTTAISHLDVNSNADSGTMTAPFSYSGSGKLTFDFWFAAANAFTAPTGAVDAFFKVQVASFAAYFVNFSVASANTHVSISISDGNVLSASAVHSIPAIQVLDGGPHHVHVTLANSGGNVVGTFVVDGVSQAVNMSGGGQLPTTAQGAITYLPASSWWLDKNSIILQGIPLTFSHYAIYDTDSGPSAYQAGIGYGGEQAHARIRRLCAEEGIPFYCTGAKSPVMGAESVGTLIDTLREAEAVDLGVLYERDFGLGYQTRSERHNAPVAWNLDFNNGTVADPPAGDDDDLQLRNNWTLTSKGTGYIYIAKSQPSIDAIGLYDDSATVSVYNDAQLPNETGWRLHLGLVDDERWPEMTVNLASTVGRTIIAQWTALGYGARIQVAHPDAYTPYTADVFLEGVQEHIEFFGWDVKFNSSPASPYAVYQIGAAGNLGRLDSATSTLTADPGTAGTTLTVATTGVRWIDSATYPSMFPFDINLGVPGLPGALAEQVTVTAIVGTSSPQTFTVTRSVNGAVLSHPAGTAVNLWQPPVYAM